MHDKLSIFILSCINFDDISKNILFIDKNVKHGYEPSNVSRGVENLLTMPSNPQCLLFGKRWTPFQFTLVVFIFLVLFNEYFIYVFQTMRWPNVPDINRYVLMLVLRFYLFCIYYCDNRTIMTTCSGYSLLRSGQTMSTSTGYVCLLSKGNNMLDSPVGLD